MEIQNLPKESGNSWIFSIKSRSFGLSRDLLSEISQFPISNLVTKINHRIAPLSFPFLALFLVLANAPWYGIGGWDQTRPNVLGYFPPFSLGGISNLLLVLLFLILGARHWKTSNNLQKMTFFGTLFWTLWNIFHFEFWDRFTIRTLINCLTLICCFNFLPLVTEKLDQFQKTILIWTSVSSSFLSLFLPLISHSSSEKSLGLTELTVRYIGFNFNQVTTVFSSTFLTLCALWLYFLSPNKSRDHISPAKLTSMTITGPNLGATNFYRLGTFCLLLFGVFSLNLAATRAGMLGMLFIASALCFWPSLSLIRLRRNRDFKRKVNIAFFIFLLGNITPTMLSKYNFLNFGKRAPSSPINQFVQSLEQIELNSGTLKSIDLIINTNGRTLAAETLWQHTPSTTEAVIFGNGTGFSSRAIELTTHGVREPHNELLRTFFDHGLWGLLILCAILISLVLNFKSAISRASLGVFLLFLLTENIFSYPALAMLPFFLLMYLFDPLLKEKEKEINHSVS